MPNVGAGPGAGNDGVAGFKSSCDPEMQLSGILKWFEPVLRTYFS